MINKLHEQKTIDFNTYSFIFTGHSLGGATCQAVLLIMMIYPPHFVSNFWKKAYAYGYGAPPVLSAEANKFIRNNVFNVIF